MLTATIRLGNAAMQTDDDVAVALRKIVERIERRWGARSGYFKTIFDENGNEVGQWKIGPVR